MEHDESPLRIGDTVTYHQAPAQQGACGLVIGRLGRDFLRVKWSDVSLPMTHRSHSLRRTAATGATGSYPTSQHRAVQIEHALPQYLVAPKEN